MLAPGADGTINVADSTATYGYSANAVDAVLSGGNYTSADVASATTCDIGAAVTPFVRITGTTMITSLGTSANRLRFVEFAGALILTYNGTSLILPGAANIVTAAGDKAIFRSYGSGNWRCIAFTPISSFPRKTLTGNLSIYVRSDGNNATTGSRTPPAVPLRRCSARGTS